MFSREWIWTSAHLSRWTLAALSQLIPRMKGIPAKEETAASGGTFKIRELLVFKEVHILFIKTYTNQYNFCSLFPSSKRTCYSSCLFNSFHLQPSPAIMGFWAFLVPKTAMLQKKPISAGSCISWQISGSWGSSLRWRISSFSHKMKRVHPSP